MLLRSLAWIATAEQIGGRSQLVRTFGNRAARASRAQTWAGTSIDEDQRTAEMMLV